MCGGGVPCEVHGDFQGSWREWDLGGVGVSVGCRGFGECLSVCKGLLGAWSLHVRAVLGWWGVVEATELQPGRRHWGGLNGNMARGGCALRAWSLLRGADVGGTSSSPLSPRPGLCVSVCLSVFRDCSVSSSSSTLPLTSGQQQLIFSSTVVTPRVTGRFSLACVRPPRRERVGGSSWPGNPRQGA